jgi:hypothetical protein
MHLQSAQIDRYLREQLGGDEVALFSAHLSLCLHCRERVAARAGRGFSWRRRGRLGRLVRAER